MSRSADVLLIDPELDERLVRTLRRLPNLRPVRAAAPDGVRRLLAERTWSFRAALLAANAPDLFRQSVLDLLHSRIEAGTLVGLATGDRPDEKVELELAARGFGLALWRPYDEHTVRFQLNRALLRGRRLGAARGALRAAVPCAARVLSTGTPRDARLYTLSRRGAFLATPRPSPVGARLEVTLLFPERQISLPAKVVHTNVPGNLQRVNAPLGMGVRFESPQPHLLDRIDREVQARLRSLGH